VEAAEEVANGECKPALDELLDKNHLAWTRGRSGLAGGWAPLDEFLGLQEAVIYELENLLLGGGGGDEIRHCHWKLGDLKLVRARGRRRWRKRKDV